ncbi:MAG: response regulator [Gammaproteobacteria bacterium]|nr:response regulator [Gammaproteobacteria bacterium]
MANNVLIVDDSAIIRKMVARNLAMADIDLGEVHLAANGREALEKLEQHWIDVVLADINMPVMNGLELIAEMNRRELTATIPVVIISTERSKERIAALKEMGVKAYINKPFTPEEFATVIKGLL